MNNADHFSKTCSDMAALFVAKNKDYSSSNITNAGIDGIACRLLDKVTRLRNLVSSSDAPSFESVSDTLLDIANYGVIGNMLIGGKFVDSVRRVYLAGPIDDSDGTCDPTQVTNELVTAGACVYSPRGAFSVQENKDFGFIMSVNKEAIRHSTHVFVYWPVACPSIGTGREIEFALSLGKKVVMFAPWTNSSYTAGCSIVASVDEGIRLVMAV